MFFLGIETFDMIVYGWECSDYVDNDDDQFWWLGESYQYKTM